MLQKLVIKTRSVEFLPFFFTLMSFINPVVWTAYAAVTSDLFIMVSSRHTSPIYPIVSGELGNYSEACETR